MMKLLKKIWARAATSVMAGGIIAFAPFATLANSQTAPQKAPNMGATWATDWSGKRLEHIMTLYTADAVFFTPEGRYAGTAALRNLFLKALAANNPTIQMHRTIAEQSLNLAHESGEYQETLASAGHHRQVSGYYLMVLRKEGGRWLIAEQMWTESPHRLERPTISR